MPEDPFCLEVKAHTKNPVTAVKRANERRTQLEAEGLWPELWRGTDESLENRVYGAVTDAQHGLARYFRSREHANG